MTNDKLKIGLGLGFLIGIVFTLVVIYLSNAVSAAQAPPCPILLKVITLPINANKGLHIVLKNSVGSPIVQGITDDNGEVMFELGGVVDCISYQATITECDTNPACIKTVAFNPNGVTEWDISAVPVPCPECPVCSVCTTTTSTTTTTLPCEECVCPDCPECPTQEWTNEQIVEVLTVVVASAGVGYGFKSYVSKTGEVKNLHKHVGIVGYHDPNIMHKNPKYRHKKGEIAPKLPNS